jgi:hypothetical protein
LLEFVETLRHECANKTSHYLRPRDVVEAWMTDLLIGHNLCNFDKKHFLFLQILLFMKGAFPNKSHLQVGYSTCFDESFIMQHWDGQYGLEDGLWDVAKHNKL